jgi:hypothetical protein
MIIQGFRQLIQYALLTLGTICGALIFWTTWVTATHPEIGVTWSFVTGSVNNVDPQIRSTTSIFNGDRISTIGGLEPFEARFLPDGKIGDVIEFVIERRGEFLTSEITLAQPNFVTMLYRLPPMIVASIFWGVGIGVFIFKSDELHGILFFLYCITNALTLAFGSVSAIAPLWSAQIFHMAMWWSAILGIHFHFFFPVRFEFKYKKSALISIYLVGILGTLVDIIGGANIDYIHPEIYELRRLWIVGSILLVILLLIFSYRENWQKQVKHQIRLIVLGSSLCLVAFASLTLIPDILFNDYIVNYSISLLFLGVIPITYAHSILQYRLIELDRYINRNFVRLLNSLLLISACFIV